MSVRHIAYSQTIRCGWSLRTTLRSIIPGLCLFRCSCKTDTFFIPSSNAYISFPTSSFNFITDVTGMAFKGIVRTVLVTLLRICCLKFHFILSLEETHCCSTSSPHRLVNVGQTLLPPNKGWHARSTMMIHITRSIIRDDRQLGHLNCWNP